MSGGDRVRVVEGTRLAALYSAADPSEEYFCNYETNAAFIPRWEAAAGLRVAARGSVGEMRAFELPDHPFFVATLFQPQLSSTSERPHPLVEGFLRIALTTEHRRV
jgi:CTP synthase (UTP-ammonia lyase)